MFTFFTLTFSILFKKKGENIFFSNFFPKMFFEKLNFFFKSSRVHKMYQVGAAPFFDFFSKS